MSDEQENQSPQRVPNIEGVNKIIKAARTLKMLMTEYSSDFRMEGKDLSVDLIAEQMIEDFRTGLEQLDLCLTAEELVQNPSKTSVTARPNNGPAFITKVVRPTPILTPSP